MAIHVALHHRTHYAFDRPTTILPHTLRLRPAVHSRTPILSYALRVEPSEHFVNWQQDAFGNFLARLVFNERARSLTFEVDLVADMTVINPFDFFLEETAREVPFAYGEREQRDLAPYLEVSEESVLLDEWMGSVDRRKQPTVDFLVDLNRRLANDISYTVRMEPGVQTPQQTLQRGSGSCRDSGWLLVQIMRRLGLAARFVSGYLVQLAPDLESLDGPSGPSEDFTDLHAWTEVYIPGAGWVGLDPTSGLAAGEGHIPLACTPSPQSAAPITGATSECEVEFSFDNRVQRLHEDPRVTLPYDDAQWQRIWQLGLDVDAELDAGDVRLTMGGEPTFVSVDDQESAQWNTAADGDDKRVLAERLARRLRDAFSPGGLLHYGQGKWYPGEPLPRWAKSCYWRVDGEPLWTDPELLARPEADLGHGAADAECFLERLAAALSLPADCVVSAHEDPVHHLWLEARLPEGLDENSPASADLSAPERRAALVKLLVGNLGAAVGYVLPLEHSALTGSWLTSAWPLRAGRLVLMPGDSPMGFRLPISSLPAWYEAPERSAGERIPEQGPDPFAPREALPPFEAREASASAQSVRSPIAGARADADRVITTALAVQARGGVLHAFLPPLQTLEAWIELVTCIEGVARETGLPIVLEGYDPPRDPRLTKFAVTPDPGVIEVNIHPARDFRALVEHTERLYEIARECRLGAEKFMLDGRHTGTGGGNHVTIGAASPSDSPLLRKPSLLRSLITYWQNHPALSYLFSGMFIGPTSQAPRVDEARDDRLYELAIAFEQMPPDETASPWMVDRVLRNLLTDLTGNTHRSEFCIDKLYSPDSSSGRLGLLELRAFEMPPHAHMAVVQMLLLRTLLAWFWRSPLERELVHWGTTLHDRFMLPYYVWEDLREVVADMQRAGYAFELEWFAPFFEFRFPRLGGVQVGDVKLELRAAIEPWHVLGEEATGSGTARYVDSSVERLQVRASGLIGDRFQIHCNGQRVPLRATGTRGEGVAGVRYKAWAPPSALHPSIGVDAPLVFDVVDSWNGRAIGGCTYHVAHAGGRSYDTFPVNSWEAEARRVNRFWDVGHSAGEIHPRPVPGRIIGEFRPGGSPPDEFSVVTSEVNPAYPLTLDLRRGHSHTGRTRQGPSE